MTQPGETTGFSAYEHLNVLIDHTDPRIVDACFVNTAPVPEPVLQRYRKAGSEPVRLDLDRIRDKGYDVVTGDVLQVDGQIRHNSEKIMKLILDHYAKSEKNRDE
jgi:2-phospho-L-lactate transferase/gluconeogenesis factor (CofD/UPF0052 family)